MAWPDDPLISVLMLVTRRALVDMAAEAVRCFCEQSWSSKELCILNTTGSRVVCKPHGSSVKEILLRASSEHVGLAILRDNANGEWCTVWEPDCWYREDVISTHMAHRSQRASVLLRNAFCYETDRGRCVTISDNRVTNASFYRTAPPAVPDLSIPLWRQTPTLKVVNNDPAMLVKFVNKIL